MKEKNGQVSYLLLAPVVMAAAHGAHALDWNVGAELGAEHHSNAGKVSSNEESDLLQLLGVGVTANHETNTLTLDADYRALIERWQDDVQDDRDTVTGFAEVAWRPVEFLRLYASNERHDLTVDSREAKTTDNSDVRDTSVVGAEFSFRFTGVDTAGIAAFYREVNYQEEGIGSERPGMLAFWRHDLSPVSSVSLSALAEQVKFDDIDQEGGRQNVYFSYQAALSALQYQVDLGVSRMELDAGELTDKDEDFTGELIRLAVDYTYHKHQLQLLLAREVTDSSLGLEDASLYGGGSFNPQDTNIENFDVIMQSQAYFSYRWDFAQRWRVGAAYRYSMDDYEHLRRDEKRHDVVFDLNYQATRTIDVGIYGGVQIWKYEDLIERDKDDRQYAGARVNWQMARQWGVTLGYEYEERDSDLDRLRYDNNIIYARLSFRLR